MKKFIVHTRPIPGYQTTDAPTIVEVEGEVITAMEDPSVMWLPEGEFKFRILKPDFLSEPQEIKRADGSKEKVMVSPVYHSHAVYSRVGQAYYIAERMVRQSFEFAQRKYGVAFTEEEVKVKHAEIQKIQEIDL